MHIAINYYSAWTAIAVALALAHSSSVRAQNQCNPARQQCPVTEAILKRDACLPGDSLSTIRRHTLSVSNGNRSNFYTTYHACIQPVVTCLKHRALGITHIGGPVKRCIKKGLPPAENISAAELAGTSRAKWWFEKTGGTCEGEHSDGKSYFSRPSPHSTGKAVDVFTRRSGNRAGTPTDYELVIGNAVRDWAIRNAEIYGIKNVIWNRKIYNSSNQWQGKRFRGHRDHVHIDCKPAKGAG